MSDTTVDKKQNPDEMTGEEKLFHGATGVRGSIPHTTGATPEDVPEEEQDNRNVSFQNTNPPGPGGVDEGVGTNNDLADPQVKFGNGGTPTGKQGVLKPEEDITESET